jgi:hypothetical protein
MYGIEASPLIGLCDDFESASTSVCLPLVLEEVVDAVLLHQSANEIQIGLAVLNAIFELRTGTFLGQLRFVVGEAAIVEDLLDDVGRLLVLEYPAIGGSRQQP